MGNDYIGSAAIYLISTLFSFYLGLVMIRFLLQLVRADFHNPLSQFIVKVTNPLLRPLRRIIPGISGIDVASLVLLLGLQVLMMWLLHMATGRAIHVGGLLLLSLAELISLLLTIYLIAIIAQAILSWIGPHPHTYNPFSSLLYSLTEPVMRPARRLIPPISGIDLSPILVIVILQLMKILVVAPITDLGRSLGYN